MKGKTRLSPMRRAYWGRFLFRCAVLAATAVLYFAAPGQFDILRGFDCFRRFSVFQLLWLVWMGDMLLQLFPRRHYWPVGSRKFAPGDFRPLPGGREPDSRGLAEFRSKSNRGALTVALAWGALTAAVGLLYFTRVIDRAALLVITVIFYVCDAICVLFWCPFRLWFMKTRCCTTCRIFNWDHLMMFCPLLFIPGFYTWSLCLTALVIFLAWEIAFARHPERFWEGSNSALRCAGCTDRLCTRPPGKE